MPAKQLDPLRDNDLPGDELRQAGWGRRLETMLTRFSVRWFNSVQHSFINVLAWGIQTSLESLEFASIQIFGKSFKQKILSFIPDEDIRKLIEELFSGKSQVGAIFMAGMAGSVGASVSGAFLAPIGKLINYGIERLVHSARLDPSTGFIISLLRPDLAATVSNGLQDQGWTPELIAAIFEALEKRADIGTYIAMMYRFPERTLELIEKISVLGYNPNAVEDLVTALHTYPGPDDLIRFGVRDAYAEDVVALYGYDESFPARFTEEMSKAGFAAGYAELYWRAHWQLPSFTQVLDMFHRTRGGRMSNPVTQTGIEDYLRIADLPSYWRQRLIDITYNIPTRVDLRRFLEKGIWTRDRVKNAYIASGYTEEDAEALTLVAESETRASEKDLTVAVIAKAYSIRQMGESESREALLGLGYDINETNLIISLWEYDLQQARLEADIDKVTLLYVEGELDETGVTNELAEYNLPGEQLTFLLNELRIKRRRKIVIPSAIELKDYYFKGIIDTAEVADSLARKNWSARHIELELRKLDIEIQALRTKAAEDAAKETQRIEADRTSKQWTKDRNRIDLLVAQARLEIADIKIVLPDVEDLDTVAALTARLDELKLYILQLAVQKAGIRQDLSL